MTFTASDYEYMARAIQLAEKGLYTTAPNPRVGCVIVKDGTIVGEGYHVKAGQAHAEINALKQAGNNAKDATVYVTLEPCCHTGKTPPCTDALINAGVNKVIAAMQDPHQRVAGKGFAELEKAGIEVQYGLMQAQAETLNPGFIKRMQSGLPWVRIKMAASLDGRTAMRSGESKWITGTAARQDVQHWRARSSVILTGVGTILADDPSLNVRMPDHEHQPLRVILDTQLRTPAEAKILQQPGQTLIMTSVSDEKQFTKYDKAKVDFHICHATKDGVDLDSVLKHLATMEVNELHVECGATLAGSFLRSGFVDEIVLYMAPKLMGDQARGLFHLPELNDMADSIDLSINDLRQTGDDIRIIMSVKKK